MAHDSTPSMVHPIASPPCPEAANQWRPNALERLILWTAGVGVALLVGRKTWDGLDFAGEVVANFLGLTRFKYQWMINLQAREEADKRQRRQLRLEQLLEQEKRKLRELEAGAGDGEVTENV